MTTLTDTAPTLVNELNLAHYLELLRRRWFLPVLLGIAFAAAMFWYTAAQPARYAARADIAVVRSGTLVNFDPRLRTVSDTDPNALGLEQVTRRRSLEAIGESFALAAQVFTELGTNLPAEADSAEALAKMVNVDVDGDLIRITTMADSPELAARIANAYANAYVARVNEVFSESPVSPGAFQTQAEQAKQDYQTKQAALEQFIAIDREDDLARQRDLILRQLNAQLEVQAKLIELEADVLSLRTLVANGQGAAAIGEELARLILQANLYNNTGDLPLQLNLTLSALDTTTTRAQQLAQLDALLQEVRARRAAYGGEASRSLHAQLNPLQVELEQIAARKRELQSARSTAWEVYQLLVSKVNETNLASATQSQTVRVANPAVAPNLPVQGRQLLNTLLAGMVGVVLGAGVALIVRTK